MTADKLKKVLLEYPLLVSGTIYNAMMIPSKSYLDAILVSGDRPDPDP